MEERLIEHLRQGAGRPKEAILRAIKPWGVVKNSFLVLDRERDVVALEMA